MNEKNQLLQMLEEEYQRWEALLAGFSEAQITARQLPSNLSIKDVVAHLMVWQQRSIARLEAARRNQEAELPGWPAGVDPESEDDLEKINAWIHKTNKDRPWSSVYRDWREGFQRLLELGRAIPEADLLAVGKYPWLHGYPLAAILEGSLDHHQEEHYKPLTAWLRQHGDMKAAG